MRYEFGVDTGSTRKESCSKNKIVETSDPISVQI